ncbi:TonB-dependent receptor [uncultured Pontibacter sp.]|uniref:TonB-dependent receptor n=1 Tax=uncultured Pontibacter sp. TaxID=453356 RepID=UPI002638C881|nr:TonB-dependent receptor [uncultured Pontibacter sp.]
MKLRFLVYTFLLCLPQLATAQNILSGYVLDANSNLPLEGATVTANTGAQALSNLNGYFSLTTTPATKSMVVSLIGYKAQRLSAPAAGEEVKILLQPDAARLQEVVITGYESNRPLLQTAGAISILDRSSVDRFDESSLVRAVNTVPGVRMEERAPASYRLSIRGSSLRSPYGIRNVKVYFDGIPFTEANGTTALNLIDAANIGSIEVLKGPTASIYGAGTGGTILLEPRRAAPGETSLQLGATTGSFGFRKYTATASIGAENSSTLVQYSKQQYDGYREQSAVDRDVLLISSKFTPSEKRTITANLVYSDLYYELPGGLTLEQYNDNPRQARGGQFGSVLQNASIDLEGINVGLKQEYRFNDKLRNTTSIYVLHKFKDNPFNTDYERNTNQEVGARSSFAYDAILGSINATFTLGAEFQRGFEVARTYDNNGGTPGDLRTDDEVVAKAGFVFAQAEFELPGAIIATTALSLNDTKYEITRLQQISSGNYKYNRDFEAVLSPRVALLKRITPKISAHASISSGFSPPTEEEILTSDGTLNEDLEAERGTNYEVGLRGFAGKLSFDVVGFYFRLKETIVSRQDVSSVAVFRNVGSTSQKGIEANTAYTLWEQPEQQLSSVKVWGSYTYSHFRFKDYQKDEDDLSGNKLTGVAPHVAAAGVDVGTKLGVYFNLTSNYVDALPLNDENTAFADQYFILGTRAGIRRTLGSKLKLEVFGGVDNLTDVKYSLGNDLNAFGSRFYQPAPKRNYYGGVNLSYTL